MKPPILEFYSLNRKANYIYYKTAIEEDYFSFSLKEIPIKFCSSKYHHPLCGEIIYSIREKVYVYWYGGDRQ